MRTDAVVLVGESTRGLAGQDEDHAHHFVTFRIHSPKRPATGIPAPKREAFGPARARVLRPLLFC